MALLELRELSTDIQLSKSVVHALDRVSLSVEAGETLGIVGESGSGKTMTAMSIERLLPAGGRIVHGEILFDGVDLTTQPDAALRRIRGVDIGMIFQDPMTSLNPVMSVGSQVAEPLVLHRGLSRSEARQRVVEMFSLVGIPSPARRFDHYPHQLSGGQRQRVMIAMALICEPKLLIADEPTTALDVTIQRQILDLIARLRVELKMAMILVTHDLGVIAGNADRVAVMYAGKVVEVADTESLFAAPKHRYTEALFEALPERAAGAGERLYSIPGLPPDLTEPPDGCRFAPRCRAATELCRSRAPEAEVVRDAAGSVRWEFACFHPRPAELPGGSVTLSTVPTAVPGTGGLGAGAALIRSDEREWLAPTREMGAGDRPLVQIRGLVKDFPVTAGLLQRKVGAVSAVAGVDLDIWRGQTVGLVGESGCGKTTLGRMVVGLDKPTDGEILFQGRRVDRLRGRDARLERRNVQLMFQDSFASLDPRMRVGSILREPLEIQHVGTSRDREGRVGELLDAVGLPRRAAERYPHEFSGGQRQRIGLARALALQPGLIVADEPVSALDVSIQAQILNLMKDLQRDRELTYLFVSHDLSVVRYLSDVIAVMYLGKLVEVGPAAEVYATPRHPYTKGLIATIPIADPSVERAKSTAAISGELPSAIDPPSGCRFRTRCPAAQDICATVEPALVPDVTAPASQAEPEIPGVQVAPTARRHMSACHFPLVPASVSPGGPR
ncbi:MAG TPA: ABC transporter ATP-binding protein [Jatrophihabitantaceae bacterium]|nr:ABC transporter ATP-binding protein [Jatrophihabitantaceae bacterium]